MPPRTSSALPAALAAAATLAATAAAAGSEPAPVSYNREIRPLLSENCFACHGPDANTREADLRLDLRDEAVHAGAIAPGDAAASGLVARITAGDPDDLMPPPESNKELTPEERELLRRWIEEGAPYQKHWAFIPVRRPAVPDRGASHPIDNFILDRLAESGRSLSPPADAATLSRRLHLDLTGLPPAPGSTPTPPAELAGSLIGTPAYGERMAVWWLDLARYADTIGYHSDNPRDVSPYRDYVIEAFRSNKRFDVFVREQLAGDLLGSPGPEQYTATAFNRLNPISGEGGIQDAEYIAKYYAERVRTTSVAFLGATMGCAECHDHKFDPFTMRDFYSMEAFFADIYEMGAYNGDGSYNEGADIAPFREHLPDLAIGRWGPELRFPTEGQTSALARIAAEIAALDPASEGADEKKKTLEAERQNVEAGVRNTLVTVGAKPREIRVLPRGDWTNRSGPVVGPAVPAFLAGGPTGAGTGDGERLTRLDLADWIVSPGNPLTARAFANRLWALFFGHGLSRDLADLGNQGRWPTHPDLLDWLAAEFVDSGWNVAHLVRLIVTSQAYQQTSNAGPELAQEDPRNELFGRQMPRRLEAEFIRDNALAIAGLLDRRVGGASVRPYQPDGYYDNLNFPKRGYDPSRGADQYRRGLYTHWQRTFLHPMLIAFDAPAREECTASRPVSNTPLQALDLLNDPTFVEAARSLAATVAAGPDSFGERLDAMFERALARAPDPAERRVLRELYGSQLDRYRSDPDAAAALLDVGFSEPTAGDRDPAGLAALTAVARAVLNLHETITRY